MGKVTPNAEYFAGSWSFSREKISGIRTSSITNNGSAHFTVIDSTIQSAIVTLRYKETVETYFQARYKYIFEGINFTKYAYPIPNSTLNKPMYESSFTFNNEHYVANGEYRCPINSKKIFTEQGYPKKYINIDMLGHELQAYNLEDLEPAYDTYRSKYCIIDENNFTITYEIFGPEKDYTLETFYTRTLGDHLEDNDCLI